MKKYIYPKKIINEKPEWLNLLKRQELQIGLSESVTSKFQDGEYLILDFGVELCGGIRILTYKAKNVPIRVRFGESLTECCSELGGDKNATNDHSLRDFSLHLQNYSDTSFGRSGFRFARLDFYGDVEIKSIVAESRIAKKKVRYEYKGDDLLVKKIYECAKRTIDLCIESGYVLDGIKRDRLVWVGDLHPETLALTTLYNRAKELEKSLDFVKNQTPLPSWMNGIPMYSMWWIIVIADYYQRTGARDFAVKQIDYLNALLQQMDLCIKENGELNYPFYFVDWPTHNQPDEILGARAINIIAIKKAIDLLTEFGQSTRLATKLLDRLQKVPILPTQSKQVTALKYLALGYLSEEDKQNLLKGGAKGLSTFMSYYILKAIASFDKEQAVKIMKEYYGAMLDKGATTFWEDFDVEWGNKSCRIDEFPKDNQKDIHGDFGDYCYKGFRHSLCHGWSAGVIAFMEEEKI